MMLALYRSGRQTEALRAFERHRRVVADELGIDPSPELARLEEQILLHDSALKVAVERRSERPVFTSVNPYKGLHAFDETDEAGFFGRDALVADLLRSIESGNRLIAVVGPSGSGKSSVVHAGLVSRLRKGTDDAEWVIAKMVPGAHPFAELEAALLRSRVDGPDSLSEQLNAGDTAILRACLRVLPEGEARLLLVIDQFEELFTLVHDLEHQKRFLEALLVAVDDPHERIVVVLALRADFYDRPLLHPGFGSRLGEALVNVTPMSLRELEEAAVQPADIAGVELEPTLLARILGDTVDQPGALPMFQYTLTELYERRVDDRLLESTYDELGGVRGAITHRAEDLYHRLRPDEQEAARQLFLRLVAMSDENAWNRRRVLASEIISLDVDVVSLQAVIDRFGAHRLLFFDRDKATGAPTVEVGHEALLNEWPRLEGWIRESRHDLLRHASFVSSIAEWERSGRDPGFLMTGARLAEYERWASASSVELNARELEFLGASLEVREVEVRADRERIAREEVLAGRARRRLWALLGAVAALVVIVGAAVLVALANDPTRVAVIRSLPESDTLNDYLALGIDEAQHRFDVEVDVYTPPWSSVEDVLRTLAEGGADLIVISGSIEAGAVGRVAPEFPDTAFAVWGHDDDGLPNKVGLVFDNRAEDYLAGVAAAMESGTGTVGFIGSFAGLEIDEGRMGFEAGVRSVDPDTEVLVRYLTATGDLAEGFERPDLGRAAARDLFERGADVIFHSAGRSGSGVFEAAREFTETTGTRVWGIGSRSDQFFDVPTDDAAFVLTSVVHRLDVALLKAVEMVASDQFQPGAMRLTAADSGVDYSTSGSKLSPATITALDQAKDALVAGAVTIPWSPAGEVLPPLGQEVLASVVVTIDAEECRADYRGPDLLPPGATVGLDVANNTPGQADGSVWSERTQNPAVIVGPSPGTTRTGYAVLGAGTYGIFCKRGAAWEDVTIIAAFVESGDDGYRFEDTPTE
jgi:basic membrane lipoprotein Med (substrate-binding protein (PBP1-ABC) superfamily)